MYQDYGVPLVGVEIEGFVYSIKGEKINVFDWLGGCIKVPNGGIVSTDAGIHQIEFSVDPCRSNQELQEKIRTCLNVLPSDWIYYWTGQDPFANGSMPEWAPKPRYKGLYAGLKAEHPDWEKVLGIANYSALNLHLEIDPSSAWGLRVINALNNQAPLLIREIHREIGVLQSKRFQNAWRGWADERRLPHWFWFKTVAEMEAYWSSIPRLYREDAKDVWVADLKTPSVIGDPVAESAIWWEARPRWSIGEKGTIEWRSLDSVPLGLIPKVINIILEFVSSLRESSNGLKVIPKDDWWQMIQAP